MDKIEYLMKHYSDVKLKLSLVTNQLLNYRQFTEESVIQSLAFEKPDGERVNTSSTHSRSEMIALTFRERLEKENKEYWDSLMECYYVLKTELEFFESMVHFIPEDLREFAQDLIFKEVSWDDLEAKYEISRSTVRYRRQKVYRQLKKCYEWIGRSTALDENLFTIPVLN